MNPTTDPAANPLRRVPGVDSLLGDPAFAPLLERYGRVPVTAAIRDELAAVRRALTAGAVEDPGAFLAPGACAARVDAALAGRTARGYPRALNATGVILHTGLGRAPLAEAAREALAEVSRSFAVLEVERDTGRRGQRDAAVSRLLAEVAGAEEACIVNNNAGATLITLAALAAGRPVVVSRGQLVEIGGSFRIPDVMEQSGARLVEVGTTNRTHLRDYARALDAHADAAVLLRVHTSNFRVLGFTREVGLEELVGLARERGVEVMDDLGSGCFLDLSPYGLPQEPVVQASVEAGAGAVTFSGDKLLGGPQAGLIVGRADLVRRVRAHPLYRALRPDKLTLAALEATLDLYRDPERALRLIPALRMISAPVAALEARARALAARLAAAGLEASVAPGTSRVGGGSYAVEELPTRVVSVAAPAPGADALARRLREGDPCVFVRIKDGRVVLDPRTLLGPEEDEEVAAAVIAAAT